MIMALTYGYDMKGGETWVTSMQRATNIFVRVATPKIFALCIAFPFGESDLMPLDRF